MPSSHNPPIISSEQTSPASSWLTETAASSETMTANTSALALAEAFAEFVATSSRLENSYRELQQEVAGLHQDLQVSLAENQRVRAALQRVVDSMPCGVLVANAAGDISTINPEIATILGIESAGQINSLAALKDESGLELRALQQSANADERECRLQTSVGERWLQIRERSLGEKNAALQTIYIISDITASKRAERDREAARNAAVLAEITTMLAHEIRNPLASLELFGELIEQDEVQRAEWISNLRAGIRSLSGTVNNVLTMHETGSLRLSQISLVETIRNAVRFVQPLAHQAGIVLEWSAEPEANMVSGNDSALQQVLLNLIRNAIRHTPAAGCVKLATSKSGGQIQISCTDSGIGIRAEQLAHLFEAGFSGSGDTPGLGLAVCRRIMQQHNGTISASNVEGSGARFLLSFPSLNKELATA